jgi:hypothetical protein
LVGLAKAEHHGQTSQRYSGCDDDPGKMFHASLQPHPNDSPTAASDMDTRRAVVNQAAAPLAKLDRRPRLRAKQGRSDLLRLIGFSHRFTKREK